MRQMIDELKAIPGVVGASIYRPSKGLLETNLPAIFKPERLSQVGKSLAKLYSAGRLSFADMTDVTLVYDESVVVVRELDRQQLLFAFCDPSFSQNLLSMSLNLLEEEFRARSSSDESASAALDLASEETAKMAATAEPESSFSTLLDRMRQRLGKVVGPMAGFIFNERVDAWQQQGAAEFSRIEELISALNCEIADVEKIERYRQLIEPELKGFQEG